MPTTDPQLVLRFLDHLTHTGVDHALLHGEPAEVTSDLDIVAARSARHLAAEATTLEGIRPILVWPYEPGGSANLFLSTPDLSEGAQIDVLYDPHGRGRLGFLSPALLATADSSRPPRVSRATELAYLIRKRDVKGEAHRLPAVVTEAAVTTDFVENLHRVAGRHAARRVTAVLEGGKVRPSHARPSARFVLGRLSSPIGAWVHLATDDPTMAEELSRRVGRVLPHVDCARAPEGIPRSLAWWASKVQPVRMRAGVFFSWGPTPPGPQPDLVLASHPAPARALVDWLVHRVDGA